eukprot:gene20440-biopygen22117
MSGTLGFLFSAFWGMPGKQEAESRMCQCPERCAFCFLLSWACMESRKQKAECVNVRNVVLPAFCFLGHAWKAEKQKAEWSGTDTFCFLFPRFPFTPSYLHTPIPSYLHTSKFEAADSRKSESTTTGLVRYCFLLLQFPRVRDRKQEAQCVAHVCRCAFCFPVWRSKMNSRKQKWLHVQRLPGPACHGHLNPSKGLDLVPPSRRALATPGSSFDVHCRYFWQVVTVWACWIGHVVSRPVNVGSVQIGSGSLGKAVGPTKKKAPRRLGVAGRPAGRPAAAAGCGWPAGRPAGQKREDERPAPQAPATKKKWGPHRRLFGIGGYGRMVRRSPKPARHGPWWHGIFTAGGPPSVK